MNLTAIITGVAGSLVTLLLGIVAKRFDFKKEQRKAAMDEDKSNSSIQLEKMKKTNDEWERMYHEQIDANKELKKDYKQLRNEMYQLQTQVNKLNSQIADLNAGFTEKEKGYLLQIESLQEENDDLREANEILQEQLKKRG